MKANMKLGFRQAHFAVHMVRLSEIVEFLITHAAFRTLEMPAECQTTYHRDAHPGDPFCSTGLRSYLRNPESGVNRTADTGDLGTRV